MAPYVTKPKEGQQHKYSCGRCPSCVNNRRNAWAFRMQQESLLHATSYFITITYNPENLQFASNHRGTLVKAEAKALMRGVRDSLNNKYKRNDRPSFKYYLRAEYGSKRQRPHYHILFFSSEDRSVVQETFLKIWTNKAGQTKGSIDFQPLNEATVKYVFKYIAKLNKCPYYEGDTRLPEFNLISKGLGKCYITDKSIKWHLDDLGGRQYCPGKDGQKIPMSRYYKDKIYNSEAKGFLKGYNEQKADTDYQELLRKHNGNLKDYYRRKAESDLAAIRNLRKRLHETDTL